eukprot:526897_1
MNLVPYSDSDDDSAGSDEDEILEVTTKPITKQHFNFNAKPKSNQKNISLDLGTNTNQKSLFDSLPVPSPSSTKISLRHKDKKKKKRKKKKKKKTKKRKKEDEDTLSDVHVNEEDHHVQLPAKTTPKYIEFETISMVVRNIMCGSKVYYSFKYIRNINHKVNTVHMEIIDPHKYTNFSVLVPISEQQNVGFFRKTGGIKPGDLITVNNIKLYPNIMENDIYFYADDGTISIKAYITNMYLITHPTANYGETKDLVAKYKAFCKAFDDENPEIDYQKYYQNNLKWEAICSLGIKMENGSDGFDLQKYKKRKRATAKQCVHEPPQKKPKLSPQTKLCSSPHHDATNTDKIWRKLCSVNTTDKVNRSNELKQIAMAIESKCRKMFGKDEKRYAAKLRDICWHLCKNKQLLESIMNKERTIEELLTMTEDELMTSQMLKERQDLKREAMKSKVTTENIDPTKRDSYHKKYILDQKCYQSKESS